MNQKFNKTMLIFYYIYLFLIALPLLLVATILFCIFTIVGTLIGNGEFWGYWPAHIWAKVCCLLTLVRVKVVGRENINSKTSYVFVANHQGAYDIFTVNGFLDHNFKWMMKQSLRKIFLFGYACERAGYIYVDRSSPSAIRRTIQEAEKRLRDGRSIVVFPEGERTRDGRLGTFKKGAYQLALEFKLPIVPLTIDGSYNILPRWRKLPRPGKITLTIHKPIAPPESEAARKTVMEETRKAIASALPKGCE